MIIIFLIKLFDIILRKQGGISIATWQSLTPRFEQRGRETGERIGCEAWEQERNIPFAKNMIKERFENDIITKITAKRKLIVCGSV